MSTTAAYRWFPTLAAVVLICLVQPAWSDEQSTDAQWGDWTKPLPLSVEVDYTLTTDYIFRGANFTDYPGKSAGDVSHQLGVAAEYDADSLGVFGASVWFQWFSRQQKLTPDDSSNLQEVSYSAYWGYELEPIAADLELGYIAYHFPRESGTDQCTHEFYVSLAFDDSGWFGTDSPVLNPTVAYYQDVDQFRGGWLELGISHDFALGDYEATAQTPILKDLTVTPSLTLGIDHRWLAPALGEGRKSTRLGNLLYGLNATYDISAALRIPEQYGRLSVGGFLYFSQALRRDLINDEFWGGMTVAWSW